METAQSYNARLIGGLKGWPAAPQIPLPQPVDCKQEYDANGRLVVRSIHWRDKVIHIDGYHFICCRFDSCRLISDKFAYVLDGCYLSADTTLELPR